MTYIKHIKTSTTNIQTNTNIYNIYFVNGFSVKSVLKKLCRYIFFPTVNL